LVRSAATDSRHDVLEEHRRLVGRIQELESWLERTDRSSEWAAKLSTMLLAVAALLRAHFGGEAEISVFVALNEEHPRFSAKISQLESEHPRILQLFGAAADRAASLQAGSPRDYDALAAQAQAAIAMLRRHEAEENEMIMNAYWDDLGGQG
jgi:hemerythrin-like domain-containing protein